MDVHGGLDIHGDVDVHADLHGDTAAEFHSEGGEGIAAAARFLSLRNLIFFAAFFGLTGTLFTVLAIPDLVVLVSAVVMGLVAGGSMHKLITYLRSSEVGEESGYVDLEIVADLGWQTVEFEHQGRHVTRDERYFVMRLRSSRQAERDLADQWFVPEWLGWDTALSELTIEAEREWVRRAQKASSS